MSNLLLSHSSDGEIKFWDLEKQGAEGLSYKCHTDEVGSISWNWDGSQFASASRDKKLRLCDPRANSFAAETLGHDGSRGMRIAWMGNSNKIVTAGFNKRSERQLSVYDTQKFDQPLKTITIDSSNGVITPFYDEGTGIIFLAGRGDSNIRLYEVNDEAPIIHYLNEYSSVSVQKSVARLHKSNCDVKKNEIDKFIKLTVKDVVEPFSFTVPRKSEYFQDDIFPPTPSYSEASMTSEEWLAGAVKEPKLVNLMPEGMKPQSEAPQVENKGPKYNFAQEQEKGKKEKSSQHKVFEQFMSHISAAAEDDEPEGEEKKKKWDDEDGW